MTKIDILNIYDYQRLAAEYDEYESILNLLTNKDGLKKIVLTIQEFGTSTWNEVIEKPPKTFDIRDIKESIIPVVEEQLIRIKKERESLLIYDKRCK